MLLEDDLIKLAYKVLLTGVHCSLALGEYLAHKFRKILQIFVTFLCPFFNFILEVSEVSLEVIKLEHTLVDEVFF